MISVAPVSNTENEIRPEAIAEDVYRSYLEGALHGSSARSGCLWQAHGGHDQAGGDR